MAFISRPIERTVRFARLQACASFLVGCALGGMCVWVAAHDGSWKAVDQMAALLFVAHLALGALFLVCAWRLNKGEIWAYVTIFISALVQVGLLGMYATVVLSWCCCFWMAFLFPTVGLIAFCAMALPDIRFQYRHETRRRQPRGFEVIPVGQRQPPPTPPPAGGHLHGGRGDRK